MGMSMSQQEALLHLGQLKYDIKKAIKATEGEYGSLGEGIEYARDAEGRFLRGEINWLLQKLDDVVREIAYLERPVQAEGVLRKMSNGRYSLITATGEEAREFTSGSGIEVLLYEGDEDDETWLATRVEHSDKDYYLVNASKEKMEGMRARIR